jgi:SpoVK/Ycf46/Vps4 family AAA+-type ATPase
MVESAIDSLVMDESNKSLIRAVARTYTEGDRHKRFNADFIHGKGEGQIILLHGPPGTGKTLTAGELAIIITWSISLTNLCQNALQNTQSDLC